MTRIRAAVFVLPAWVVYRWRRLRGDQHEAAFDRAVAFMARSDAGIAEDHAAVKASRDRWDGGGQATAEACPECGAEIPQDGYGWCRACNRPTDLRALRDAIGGEG